MRFISAPDEKRCEQAGGGNLPPPYSRSRSYYFASALYLASEVRRSFMAVSESTPAFLAPSAQVLTSGSAAFFPCADCSPVCSGTSCPASALILGRPSSSNLPHGPPTLPASSVLQWLSIAFFWRSDI